MNSSLLTWVTGFYVSTPGVHKPFALAGRITFTFWIKTASEFKLIFLNYVKAQDLSDNILVTFAC